MASDELSFTRFSAELMEREYARMLEAVEGLSDEQLWVQPWYGANLVGWLVWHLSRFKDIQTGRVAGDEQVWVAEGWAERFGMRANENGYRHEPEDVAAFRASRELLLGYAEAAHRAAVRRVSEATDEVLHRPSKAYRPPRPAYHLLLVNAIDYTEHTGQIAYLSGMLKASEPKLGS
jgi:hypothetical protein